MTWRVAIENVAGIRDAEATIEPGTNAVKASNWRGKSSLIAAIEAAIGADAPLTEGEERGSIRLATEDREVAVELVREAGTTVRRGDRYLDEEQDRRCAELFAFLDDDNEVRRAVRNGDDLATLLTEPLDLEDIDRRIEAQRRERDQRAAELERAEAAAERLPALDTRIEEVAAELDRLAEREAALAADAGDAGSGDREALSDARAERERTADRIDRLEETVSSAADRLAERRVELEALTVPDDGDVEAELAEAREALRSVERDVELLRSVYEANSRIVEEGRVELVSDVEHGLVEDAVDCWVCGGSADRESIDEHLAALRERIASRQSAAASHREEVESLTERRQAIEQARRREADLEAAIADLEATLADRRESLETATSRLDELDERIETLEAAVEDRSDELTDVRSEQKYLERELSDAREERAELEDQADARATLREEIDALDDAIERLRGRKEAVRRDLREAFSVAMEEIIERFDVSFESARLTGNFELVVARDGREAGLDALSEGEVELLGIVAALAGHEAYDVAERVPIVLLDGIGGLAADNLARLVTYLEGRATYLVLTAYPEHQELDAHELDPGRWTVVSDPADATAT